MVRAASLIDVKGDGWSDQGPGSCNQAYSLIFQSGLDF